MNKFILTVIVMVASLTPIFSQEKVKWYPNAVWQGRFWPAGNYVFKDGEWYRDGVKELGVEIIDYDLIKSLEAEVQRVFEAEKNRAVLRERINLYNPYAQPTSNPVLRPRIR